MSSNHPIPPKLAHHPQWELLVEREYDEGIHCEVPSPIDAWKLEAFEATSGLPVIFDKFTGQGTESLLELLEDKDNYIYVVMLPANCTDRLQPVDISVNKLTKKFLRQQFQAIRLRQV